MKTEAFAKIGRTMKGDNRHYRRVDPQGEYHAAADQWDKVIDAATAAPGLFQSIADAIAAGHNLEGLLSLAVEAKGAGVHLAQLRDDAHVMARIRKLGGVPEAILKAELNRLIRAQPTAAAGAVEEPAASANA
jgi:hypothetical protein